MPRRYHPIPKAPASFDDSRTMMQQNAEEAVVCWYAFKQAGAAPGADLNVFVHHSQGSTADTVTHSPDVSGDLKGYKYGDATKLVSELFSLAKLDSTETGSKTVVVRMPCGAKDKQTKDKYVNILILNRNVTDREYKDNVKDVLGVFMASYVKNDRRKKREFV